MKEIKNLDKRISTLKDQLENVTGTQTEVYTRIVGYYRSVKNWNNGKREEFNVRQHYNVDMNKLL